MPGFPSQAHRGGGSQPEANGGHADTNIFGAIAGEEK